MLSSLTQSQQISSQRLLVISYIEGFFCKSLVTHPFVCWVSNTPFIYHIGEHGRHLLLGLFGPESVNKLQLLVHKTHVLNRFIVDWFHLTSRFVDFILKCLNDLCELIGWGDGDSVSLVLFRIKDCQVVVAGLVRLLHFTRETFRLISDSFVLSLYNSSGVLVFVVLVFLLVDGELHFVEGFSTRKVAWKTGNDGLSNEFFSVIVFMCAEGLELSWHLLFNINII